MTPALRRPGRESIAGPSRECDRLAPLMAEERADHIIRDAEGAKARILTTPGRNVFDNGYLNSVMMDDDFMLVGSHVDEVTYTKIIEGKYVDFGKLIPWDKVIVEEDQRLEMVIRGGCTFWVPPNEGTNINGFAKWEQAFRAFSNIYTKQFPGRAAELIEYNHIIHSISSVYIWDNVYNYDKDFRIHKSKNPNRSWSVILQHSWSLRLCDKAPRGDTSFQHGSGSKSNNNSKSTDPCHRYNKGKCNFGTSCRYEHKCSYCFKYGHTILNCRKLQADLECGAVTRASPQQNSRSTDKRDSVPKDRQPQSNGS